MERELPKAGRFLFANFDLETFVYKNTLDNYLSYLNLKVIMASFSKFSRLVFELIILNFGYRCIFQLLTTFILYIPIFPCNSMGKNQTLKFKNYNLLMW